MEYNDIKGVADSRGKLIRFISEYPQECKDKGITVEKVESCSRDELDRMIDSLGE